MSPSENSDHLDISSLTAISDGENNFIPNPKVKRLVCPLFPEVKSFAIQTLVSVQSCAQLHC